MLKKLNVICVREICLNPAGAQKFSIEFSLGRRMVFPSLILSAIVFDKRPDYNDSSLLHCIRVFIIWIQKLLRGSNAL